MHIFLYLPLIMSMYTSNNCDINEPELQNNSKKELFSKNVWSEIDFHDSVNTVLFSPYNEIPVGRYTEYDTELDSSSYQYQFKKNVIKWNLWNVIRYNAIFGNLNFYCPYNPDWFETKDNGFLMYPFASRNKGNYFNDELLREEINSLQFISMEMIDPFMVAYTDMEGYDSIDVDGNVVYPPNEIIFYKDKDIIKYNIKETWIYDLYGNFVKKHIDAIAPVMFHKNENGEIIGEKELFWVDFQKLKQYLNDTYIKLPSKKGYKLISYSTFFEDKLYQSSIVKEDEFFKKWDND